jgi:hypothetical protein
MDEEFIIEHPTSTTSSALTTLSAPTMSQSLAPGGSEAPQWPQRL